MLGPQAVDERVDEAREVVAGWEDVQKHRTLHFRGNGGTSVKKFCLGVRNVMTSSDKLMAFQEKLDLWERKVHEGDISMFKRTAAVGVNRVSRLFVLTSMNPLFSFDKKLRSTSQASMCKNMIGSETPSSYL